MSTFEIRLAEVAKKVADKDSELKTWLPDALGELGSLFAEENNQGAFPVDDEVKKELTRLANLEILEAVENEATIRKHIRSIMRR